MAKERHTKNGMDKKENKNENEMNRGKKIGICGDFERMSEFFVFFFWVVHLVLLVNWFC